MNIAVKLVPKANPLTPRTKGNVRLNATLIKIPIVAFLAGFSYLVKNRTLW